LFIALGCAYLFQKDTILRINAFMREKVFRDSYVLLEGKRLGGMLTLAGVVLVALATLRLLR